MPCVGYKDDYGPVLPKRLTHAVSGTFTSFIDCLEGSLKKGKSDAGPKVEFLRVTAALLGGSDGAIAELSLAPERIRKWVAPLFQTREAGTASLAHMQKFAGKLSIALTATMGRFGKSAMKIMYVFFATNGGRLPKEFQQCLLPEIAPRSILWRRPLSAPSPIRLYLDAAVEGGLASLTSLPNVEAPFLLRSQADQACNHLALTKIKVYR